METQDQATAEQYYRVHGYYPSWYSVAAPAYTGARNYPYPEYTGFPGGYPLYPGAYSAYGTYPTAFAGVKNVATAYATPYATYPYGYGFNGYPYAPFGAVPYVAAAPAATPAKV